MSSINIKLYILFTVFQLFSFSAKAAPPTNDTQANAILLTQLTNWTSSAAQYSNVDATTDGASGSCSVPNFNVWFKFQATSTYINLGVLVGGAEGSLRGPSISLRNNTGLEIICGSSPSSSTIDKYIEASNLVVGEWYYIAVHNASAVTSNRGTFTLFVSQQRFNDMREWAVELTQKNHWTSDAFAYTNVNATKDGSSGSCGSSYSNVWFKFQATTSYIDLRALTGAGEGTLQRIGISLWNSTGSQQIACVPSLSNTDDALMEVNTLIAGEWYYVSVESGSSNISYQGTFSLYVNDQPSFNWREGAIELTEKNNWTSTPYAYSNVGATSDGPSSNCGQPYSNVWFKFQAATTYINLSVLTGTGEGSITNAKIALWNNSVTQVISCSSSSGTQADVSLTADNLVLGQWYFISVQNNGSNPSNQGTFTLSISDQPSYDLKAGAIELTQKTNWTSTLRAYTNVGATGNGSQYSDVWFKFQATTQYMEMQALTGDEEGSVQNVSIALWDNSNSTLAQSQNTGGATDAVLEFNALTIGQWYYIAVYNRSSNTSYQGTFTLYVNDQPNYNNQSAAVILSEKNNWCSPLAFYNNVRATTDGFNSGCGNPNRNVWFKFQAETPYIKFNLNTGGTEGTLTGAQMFLQSSQGNEIICINNPQGTGSTADLTLERTNLSVGEWYYISVFNMSPSSTAGTFSICISDQATSDFKIGAAELVTKNWLSAPASYSNLLATTDGNGSNCGSMNSNVWFKFRADTELIQLELKTGGAEGTIQYPRIALFDNSDFRIACQVANGAYGDITLTQSNLVVGEWYYVSVFIPQNNSYQGTFTFGIFDQPDCTNMPVVQALQSTATCAGSTNGAIRLVNTQSDITYRLSTGQQLLGTTGQSKSWTNLPSGNYIVTAARGSCAPVTMGSVDVNAIPQPVRFQTSLIVGNDICEPESGQIQLSGSENSVNYKLWRSPIEGGDYVEVQMLAGTGNPLAFSAPTIAGVYQIIATNAQGCSLTMENQVTQPVSSKPLNQSFSGQSAICEGTSGTTLMLSGSQIGVTYQLTGPGISISTNGTGGVVKWTDLLTPGTYSVRATNISTGCWRILEQTITLSAAAQPLDFIASADQSICFGESSLISINGSQSNVKYQVKADDLFYGSPVDGKGNSAVLPLAQVTQSKNYQVIATNLAGCTRVLSGNTSVTVNPLPVPFLVTGGGAITNSLTSFPVSLSNSEGSNFSYLLLKDGVSTGSSLSGVSAQLNWPAQSGKGTYTVLATNTSSGCSNLMNESATIFESFETILNNLAFQYKYDARNRMVAKKVPGADWMFMVYDERDRLVLTQDGEQRKDNKWLYTKYDALNRPVMTGIYTHSEPQTQEQMSARISTSSFFETYNGERSTHGYTNSVWPTENIQFLTATYYDNYAFVTPLINNGDQNITSYNYQLVDVTDQYQYGTGPQKNFPRVVGQVTGTKTNILGSSENLFSISYYDDKYRLIQSISQNHKGGTVIVTNVYDFVGKLLESKRTYSVSGENVSLKENFQYDHAGRLTTTKHSTTGANGTVEVLLTENKYNELGQLIDKKLHSSDNGTTFKQSVDYRYNIRGWLTNINESNLTGDEPDDFKDLFGMQLAYNDDIGTGNTINKQYNGNISGLKWSHNLGLGAVKQMAYNYTYDRLNRLTAAGTKNNVADVWVPPVASAFSEDNITYDLNGNILTLNRKGSNGAELDILSYKYYNGSSITRSNQLLNVDDSGDKKEGFVDGVNGGHDYDYDANGNMMVDRNKNIVNISYNHLNLPARVTKQNGDYIEYTYTAAGQKLYQTVNSSEADPVTKVTDYLGELLYENGELKFINHSEGRIVPEAGSWVYQYHLKDHLGNVRTTFTTKEEVEAPRATFEVEDQQSDAANFLRYDKVRRVTSHLFDRTNGVSPTTTPGYAQRLNGTQYEKFGLARSLSVMPGDKLNIEVYAKYLDTNKSNWTVALSSLLAQIASSSGGGVVLDGGAYTSGTNNFPFTIEALANTQNSNESGPKAYLNWLIFDTNFKLLNGGYDRLSNIPREYGQDIAHERLFSPEILIKEPGFVYIFISNEEEVNNVEVYFDDFKVTHTKSPVIQSDDYYPFGATFNSYSRESSVPNKRLYQGKEYQNDLSLNIYDSEWRQYDPWGVRTTTIDPHAERYFSQSPYSWSANNPVKFIDPDGRDYYLNLYSGRVEHIEGRGSQFDKAYVHIAGDGASVVEIQDGLNSRGYNYAVNGNVPGGYAVDTRSAYKGWIMMQTFSEENVGAIMWMGGNAWASGLPTSKAAGRAASVWGMNPAQRGMMIERGLGGNLPTNFPVIDKLANGVATSIKSVDLTAKSYQKSGALLGTLKSYVNTLKNFSGTTYGKTTIQEGIDFTSKSLEVAIQPGKASLNQWEQIAKAMQYAKDNGIEFALKFVK